jgi:hypothetical protein
MNNEIIGCNVCYDPPEEIDAFQWAEDHSNDSELEDRFIERFEVD